MSSPIGPRSPASALRMALRYFVRSFLKMMAGGYPRRTRIKLSSSRLVRPFLDGNGRTSRLLLNLILVRLGYPPAIIFKNERTKYLSAMRKADAGDLGPMGELIARSVTNNLYRFVIPAVAGPARLV